MVVFSKDRVIESNPGQLTDGPAIVMADPQESEAALRLVGVVRMPGFPLPEDRSVHFESRATHDYLSFYSPSLPHDGEDIESLEAYLTPACLLVIGQGKVYRDLRQGLMEEADAGRTPVRGLTMLFNLLIIRETGPLDAIDQEIDRLEEKAADRKPEDHASELSALRKKLTALTHYFNTFYDLMDDLEENRNGLLAESQLQVIRAYKNKVNRLAGRSLNLRERLTQVREAFQNQLDISLNDTMRFFTVLTSVFLPLTLIVGWYGMNLRMPELQSAATYPVIIVVSLAFIAISLLICKKKGWF